jgi:mono/diheme cytochrome c family protein
VIRTVVAAAIAVFIAPTVARAETPVERGAYLVKHVVACGACHTNPAPGSPELAGGQKFSTIAFNAYAANLTPDPETGIGSWTDEELIAGFREGRRPHGSIIGPPMPVAMYRAISDDDAKAIVAYLRSLPAVVNKTPRSSYRIRLPANYGPPLGHVAAVAPSDTKNYVAYVASLAHCMACHTRRGEDGAPDFANGLGAGGTEFRGAWGVSLAPNITPSGIGHYSDDDLRKLITTGIRPDGSKLKPPMPIASYARMTDTDVSAIIGYLKALPKK